MSKKRSFLVLISERKIEVFVRFNYLSSFKITFTLATKTFIISSKWYIKNTKWDISIEYQLNTSIMSNEAIVADCKYLNLNYCFHSKNNNFLFIRTVIPLYERITSQGHYIQVLQIPGYRSTWRIVNDPPLRTPGVIEITRITDQRKNFII